jgi:ADP-heptose:LPS heptosyltransferase
LTPSQADVAARQAARAVRESLAEAPGAEPDWAALDLLVEIAASSDGELSQIGKRELFGTIVEPINDTHLEELRPAYNRLFAQVIQQVRRLPGAQELDQRLAQHGVVTEAQLVDRAEQVSRRRPFEMAEAHRVRKVFLLSRVTIGAEIAVNAPAIEHLRRVFPHAEIVLFGDTALSSLFSEVPGMRIRAVAYVRAGNLTHFLGSYLDLEQALQREIVGLTPDEFLIVGMDSRLDQLMLLPLTPFDKERYFGWRNTLPAAELYGQPVSIATQAANWLQRTFPTAPYPLFPTLTISRPDQLRAESIYRFHGLYDGLIVTMNFGVGGNERKRVGEAFELELASALIRAGAKILVSVAPDSESPAARLRVCLEQRGIAVANVVADQGSSAVADSSAIHLGRAPADSPAVLFVKASLGQTAALIVRSNLYIGYDSMAHHMAAAVGRDVIAVFAGYDLPYFPDRWRPTGPGRIDVLRAGGGPFDTGQQTALAGQVLSLFRSLHPA